MNRTLIVASLSALALALPGCDDKSASNAPQTTPDNPSTVLGKSAKMARDTAGAVATEQAKASAMADAITGQGERVNVAGITFAVPSTWTKVQTAGGSTMSPVAEYRIDGDDGASRLVFFNTGGSAQMNIDRWKGQMKEDDGQPSRADVQTMNVAGAKVTTVQMEGTYTGMNMGGASAPQRDTMFLGAIFEGRQGQVQIRLTGPYRDVKALLPLWKAMIEGAQGG